MVAGVVVGILVGWYQAACDCSPDPFLNALYATPRVAMVPLILIWFGIGMWSKVFIVFISAFFPVLVNTVGGMRAIDRDLLRAARAFCASDWQIFKTVAIPGVGAVHPHRRAPGRRARADRRRGGRDVRRQPGHRLHGRLRRPDVRRPTRCFVGVVIIAFAGIVLTWLAERLERRFSQWRPERVRVRQARTGNGHG